MIYQDVHKVSLELEDHTSFGRAFTLRLQNMGEGIYRVERQGLRSRALSLGLCFAAAP